MKVYDELINKFGHLLRDPVVEFMIAQGFDPAKGGVLVLPLDFEDKFLAEFHLNLRPNYVVFSKLVQQPMLMMGFQPHLYGNPVTLESLNEQARLAFPGPSEEDLPGRT